jgi:mannobiose 2-epimerase
MMDRRTALFGIGATIVGATSANAATPSKAAAYRRIAREADDNLRHQDVTQWFPRAMDSARGGYHQNYAEDWSFIAKADRAAVYQARLTWLSAQAVSRYPAEAKVWAERSNHGLAYLNDHIWDAEHGGFYWGLEAAAPYAAERGGEKHLYGHAFCTYAAAANYQHTRNPAALDLARRAFEWMDAHAHDAVNGGYIESVDRLGKPLVAALAADGTPTKDALNTPIGQKSMNTHIHILEALTGLYEVWPDRTLRARLEEVFLIVRDRVATRPGHLHLYFQRDWTPVPRAISFGHDVETGFLLVEASTILGRPNDAQTWEVARMLVDTPLANGWDKDNGGFYDESDLAGKLTRTDKIWWVQAEGLNALLLMHEKFGGETSRYWDAFVRQWAFIQQHQVDHRYGGWYSRVATSGAIQPGLVKSNRWTEGYHQGRALMRVSDRLRKLAVEAA